MLKKWRITLMLGVAIAISVLINEIAAGSAALLILILLVINIASRSLGRLIQRRVTAA